MGIESTFACNRMKDMQLEDIGESRFRTLWQPIMFGVSHAQRPPRQRLRSSAFMGINPQNLAQLKVNGASYGQSTVEE
jgi:hypothetical protein